MSTNQISKWLFIVMLGMASALSCGSDDGEVPQPEQPVAASLELIISEKYTVAGHAKPLLLSLKAMDTNGNELINPSYSVLVNGEDKGRLSTFKSPIPGRFELQAVVGAVESNVVYAEVREQQVYQSKKIRVIFHIVHDGEPLGTGYNISQDRIAYQMGLLEKVFEQSSNLTPNSSLPNIDFELAGIDPEGNELSEPGINRLQRPDQSASVLFEDWMWNHYWDPDYYINVWVGDTKNGYSWGIYPEFSCAEPTAPEGLSCTTAMDVHRLEGIALELNNLYDENWVFPHEMGHVFGLFHIFSGSECSTDVDFCKDTRQYDRVAYESTSTAHIRTSCTGDEFISYNVMDYWQQLNGARDLTYDQVQRIRAVVDNGLWRAGKSLSEGTPRDMSDIRSGG